MLELYNGEYREMSPERLEHLQALGAQIPPPLPGPEEEILALKKQIASLEAIILEGV